MNAEVWKPVRGYEGVYEVSDLGRVRRLAKSVACGPDGKYLRTLPPTILRPQMTRNGYQKVNLCASGMSENRLVHRLVAEHHLPPPEGDQREVNHVDLCKTNNRVSNLEWSTHQGNIAHARSAGRFDPVRNPNKRVKLSPDDIATIRASAAAGALQRDIGARHGIQQSTVSKIVLGQRWAAQP
ncbi:hypothetical protein EM868_22575 [Cupriavidus gilardii]|uniref:NUMOD4 domain-containing protein n=1 Tax=Cupriavidus gilardii TaxID=82541 RepID=UPI001EE537FC|nr:NUMOD4 domain-containing protein [Cupriavidus gilardii]MCG5259737.1 NUMOD4 motif-containing HNH endonuclease [Cupriavidus gilardii]MDF9432544.1 hypothetical protein [Cupriavidus gilardii]